MLLSSEEFGLVMVKQLWDLSDQYAGSKKVTSNFFRGSSGVFLCFSLIDNKSDPRDRMAPKKFQFASRQYPVCHRRTKCDLGSMPVENWSFLCESENLDTWFQTSAKSGVGVKESFEGLVKMMLDRDERTSVIGFFRVMPR